MILGTRYKGTLMQVKAHVGSDYTVTLSKPETQLLEKASQLCEMIARADADRYEELADAAETIKAVAMRYGTKTKVTTDVQC